MSRVAPVCVITLFHIAVRHLEMSEVRPAFCLGRLPSRPYAHVYVTHMWTYILMRVFVDEEKSIFTKRRLMKYTE